MHIQAVPSPRGALRTSSTRGGMRWTRQRQAMSRDGRAGRKARELTNGTQTNGANADGKAVWFWHPLLVLNPWRQVGPTGPCTSLQSADDGDKTNSSPGRARNKPLKTLRGQCRVYSGEPVVTTLVCSFHL